MTDRYRATELSVMGSRTAAVIDDGRRGQVFCMIPAAACCDGDRDTALARAKDIAALFNQAAAGEPAWNPARPASGAVIKGRACYDPRPTR